jgi:SAM-dependent methyltransferase
MLRKLLSHPLTHDLDLNDPRTTELRREIIRRKPFLLKIYREWYAMIHSRLPEVSGLVLELGAGAGFLNETIDHLIPTELFLCSGITAVVDAQSMPFASASLRAIVFTDVLHHLPEVRRFFTESSRCVQSGGRIIMIEPWVSGWSNWVYTHFHHERFDPLARTWEFSTSGPLSGSNQALPWIIFVRDRGLFEREFPEWRVVEVRPFMPLRYLVSGGLTTRNIIPVWSYTFWKWVEGVLPFGAMFVCITLERMNEPE